MKALNSLVTIACACVIAGCANVYSTGPMGETPFVVKADEWQGTWVHKDGSVDIKVIDTTSGRLQIRAYLGSVLRRLGIVQREGDDPTSILSLDVMKMEMKENDSTVNGVLESMIREENITPLMATSLMNDATYAYDVTKNLVQMGEVLFATGMQSLKDAERIIALDEDDIAEVLELDRSRD